VSVVYVCAKSEVDGSIRSQVIRGVPKLAERGKKSKWLKADPHSHTAWEWKCCRKTDSSTQIHVLVEGHDSLRNNMLNCSRSLDHVNDGVPATVQCDGPVSYRCDSFSGGVFRVRRRVDLLVALKQNNVILHMSTVVLYLVHFRERKKTIANSVTLSFNYRHLLNLYVRGWWRSMEMSTFDR